MRLDNLFQFVVPLAFLAIWALTSLFNRETQPLPPRANRPGGPRPSPSLSPRDPTGVRPNGSGPSRPQARPGARLDDDIVILEPEPRRSPSALPTTSRPGTATPRRAAKARPPGPASPRRAEVATPRTLGSSMEHPVDPPTIQSMGLRPLSLPKGPLLSTPNDEAAKTQAGRALFVERDSFSLADIQLVVSTPARLREGFILSELLQPPIALRGVLGTRRR